MSDRNPLPRRAAWRLALLPALALFPGCTVETHRPGGTVPVGGRVTYQGGPVKQGMINFLPIGSQGVAASGRVVEGRIRDVTTRTTGDGLKPGHYGVTVSAYDDTFREDYATRGPSGPDPAAVSRAAVQAKRLIPDRYANQRTSGLTARVTHDGPNEFEFDLKDD